MRRNDDREGDVQSHSPAWNEYAHTFRCAVSNHPVVVSVDNAAIPVGADEVVSLDAAFVAFNVDTGRDGEAGVVRNVALICPYNARGGNTAASNGAAPNSRFRIDYNATRRSISYGRMAITNRGSGS